MAFAELVQDHLTDYKKSVELSVCKLSAIFDDVGYTRDEQEAEIQALFSQVEQTWLNRVSWAEGRRTALQEEVDNCVNESHSIQRQLGLEPTGLKLANLSIRACLEKAKEHVASWRQKRQQKLSEYEDLQAVNNGLRFQLGLPAPEKAKPDLTPAGFDYLQLEKERLLAEQTRRMGVLRDEMARLKAVCSEVLGEDVHRVASEVHPSLRHYSFTDPSESEPTTGDSSPSHACVDLTSNTLEGVAAKTRELHQLKSERETQLQQLEDVLLSLWQAVGVAEKAPERANIVAAMTGPNRLHADRMEKVRSEVHRLEECRTQAMRDLILSKARELQDVCTAAHLPVPDLKDILGDLARPAGSSNGRSSSGSGGSNPAQNPGQISDCLARVVRALAEARQAAERREPLVNLIRDVSRGLEEVRWLKTYEADPEKYKGRDMNQRLQRANKAKVMKEHLPARVDKLQKQLEAWQLTEGGPFLYDGSDYMDELQAARDEIQQMALEEQARSVQRSAQKQKPAAGRPGAPPTPFGRGALGNKANASVQLTTPSASRRTTGAFSTMAQSMGPHEIAAALAASSLQTPPMQGRRSSTGGGMVPPRVSTPGASSTTPAGAVVVTASTQNSAMSKTQQQRRLSTDASQATSKATASSEGGAPSLPPSVQATPVRSRIPRFTAH